MPTPKGPTPHRLPNAAPPRARKEGKMPSPPKERPERGERWERERRPGQGEHWGRQEHSGRGQHWGGNTGGEGISPPRRWFLSEGRRVLNAAPSRARREGKMPSPPEERPERVERWERERRQGQGEHWGRQEHSGREQHWGGNTGGEGILPSHAPTGAFRRFTRAIGRATRNGGSAQVLFADRSFRRESVSPSPQKDQLPTQKDLRRAYPSANVQLGMAGAGHPAPLRLS